MLHVFLLIIITIVCIYIYIYIYVYTYYILHIIEYFVREALSSLPALKTRELRFPRVRRLHPPWMFMYVRTYVRMYVRLRLHTQVGRENDMVNIMLAFL